MAIKHSQNAVRVFSDLAAVSEPFFYLYAQRNSDAVQKIKIYPWSARIFASAVGDTWAFGTSDGRTLTMTAMAHPVALETSFPITGTANADNGCPPYWAPSAVHVTLSASGSAFQLADTSTNELVFIREFDGVSWTPTRWVRKQSGRATTVRCTYLQVALATLDGATLSIAAPPGTTIGGTSHLVTNPFMPVATGTTRNVTNVATFKTAIAAAVAGDEIVLAAGTYAMDIPISNSTFVANNTVNGRVGFGGILIRGGTGNKADVILTGNGTGTNGTWLMEGDAVSFAGMRDLSFDCTGVAIQMRTTGGKVAYQDIALSGIAIAPAEALLSFDCITHASTIEALRVTATDSINDCVDGSGDTPGSANCLASRARFVNCTAVRPQPNNQNNQCISTHFGFAMEWYGGLISDALNNAAAPDALASGQYLFFTTVTKGSHSSGLDNCYLFGCDIEGATFQASKIGGDGGAWFNRISFDPTTTNAVFQDVTQAVEHNVLTCSTSATGAHGARSLNSSGTTDGFRYNVLSGFANAIDTGGSSSIGGSTAYHGNTIFGNSVGARLEDTHLVMALRNNACKTNGTGIYAPVITSLTTDYNTIDPTIAGLFVAGAHDLIAGDAALDASLFPTASGNCDGNGDTALEDFIGDSDPWGFVRVYLASRVSRGARDRAAMHAGAYLYPDLF